ncbi:MAG: peptide chain release factor N(5)-glutamine methyltransferase [Rhodoplanes sp.]|uniref:peptide chain release factor N(5)-glutamine methyltransferase n=1 Tax=Rhodoplanes sp. TaxID=1968906 RepID=UPI0018053D5E|nr:peptide chain release factor N(5)-glutamine methyltransferase [Rhodoplanes sp.]NVO14264.1 peptide chain release factor N(5)-glutamine methyltransferase [Rhodoplanes sp.]
MDRLIVAPGLPIGAARRALAAALRGAGCDTPELDARLLIGHALGLDHAGLAVAAERPLSADEARRIDALAQRRRAHEPVSRILGSREFWSLPLAVTPAVLDPRPDTETVVTAALAAIDARHGRGAVRRIADLGTGSGALLLALLSELPQAHGIGTDRSLAALAVAGENARRLGLVTRAAFVACDYGSALAGGLDLVVSNPPYIRSTDIATLAPEVRDHDPHLALDGGPDGLDAYRAIAADAPRLLAPGGTLVVEVGAGQAAAVVALFDTSGLDTNRSPHPDFSGVLRAVMAQQQT